MMVEKRPFLVLRSPVSVKYKRVLRLFLKLIDGGVIFYVLHDFRRCLRKGNLMIGLSIGKIMGK